MANGSTNNKACKENEKAFSQWKIDLVGTFFHKKQDRPAAQKQALVFEDCDISSICVSNDDITENSYNDHEGTLTSSPVPVWEAMFSLSSLGKAMTSSSVNNSESKTGKLNDQKKISIDESRDTNQNKTIFPGSEVDVENTRIGQEVDSGNRFAHKMELFMPVSTAAVSSCPVFVSVDSQEIIARPLLILKSSASLSSVPPISASPNIHGSYSPVSTVSSVPPVIFSLPTVSQIRSSSSEVQESPSVSSSAGLASNSEPISTIHDGNSLALATAPSEGVNIPSVRPILLSKSPPASKQTDQGRNCVSVILKSSRLDPKAARLNTIAIRQANVEQLVSRYSLKFGHKSSPGVQVRLDYCFNKPSEARQFFIAVHDLEQSKSPPKFLSCFLLSEIDLGYEHQPVLTEYDLLAIQSPSYCRNVFRTPILIKVVQEGEMVSLKFKTVADVNRFLFNKSGSKTIRSLGQLRMNPVNNKMIPDQEGLYSLFTEERQISQKFAEKHKFTIKPKMEYGEDASLIGGNLLLFSTRLDLFKFLFSEDAAELDHLQFLKSKIVNCPDPNKKDVMISCKYSEKILNESGGYDTGRKIKVKTLGNGLQQEEKVKVPSKYSEVKSIKPNGDGLDIKINVKDEIRRNDLQNKGWIHLEAAGKVPSEVKQGVTQDALPHSVVSSAEAYAKVKICPEEVANNFIPRSDIKISDQFRLKAEKVLMKVPAKIPLRKKSDDTVREDDASIKMVLAQKDEEIIRLRGKLLAKEKVIETEIRSKIAVKSELREACMQLEKIHNLSHSLHGN